MIGLEIKKSKIHSYGVFATKDFSKGDIVEKCLYIKVKRGILKEYAYECPGPEDIVAVLLGYGSIYNHSYNPNILGSWDEDFAIFKAIKDIKKGEELFQDYGKGYWQMLGIEPK